MPLHVQPDHLAMVREVLRRHVPDREVRAFGSRVTGTAKATSDLDLAIVGDGPLGFATLAAMRDDFSESNLPYGVDIIDWSTVDESFRRIIERDQVVIRSPDGDST